MKTRLVLALLALTALVQTGCTVNMRDAFSAGVYDFVSGSVTSALTNLVGLPS